MLAQILGAALVVAVITFAVWMLFEGYMLYSQDWEENDEEDNNL